MRKTVIAAILASIALAACSDATNAKWAAQGKPHIIAQYSGGKEIGHWESTGKVVNEEQSDGYYFEDAATRQLVTVSGTVAITVK